ncbi:hypothetical protein Tco_0135298 [Tanacetum coccineum]
MQAEVVIISMRTWGHKGHDGGAGPQTQDGSVVAFNSVGKLSRVDRQRSIDGWADRLGTGFLYLLQSGSIAAISGQADYVTDGHQFVGAHNNMQIITVASECFSTHAR